MGERGPKPDPDQAAKGYPGRRQAKADEAAQRAAKVAKLLEFRSAADVDVPPFLQDAMFDAAASIWRKLAPELRRTHRLPPESEINFMRFCVYAQEWFDATLDLHANGFEQHVGTVAGGSMERRRPKVFDRQQAHQDLMDLSADFGLTPGDMYVLFKGQAAVALTNPGLFTEGRKGLQAPALPFDQAGDIDAGDDAEGAGASDQGAASSSRIGGLAGMRSTPPGEPKPN